MKDYALLLTTLALQELTEIVADNDMTGVDVVAADLASVPRFVNKTRLRASTLLNTALQHKNAHDGLTFMNSKMTCNISVIHCLNVLCNVDALGTQISHTLNSITNEICESFCAFGQSSISRAGSEAPKPITQRPGGAALKAGTVSKR